MTSQRSLGSIRPRNRVRKGIRRGSSGHIVRVGKRSKRGDQRGSWDMEDTAANQDSLSAYEFTDDEAELHELCEALHTRDSLYV